MSSQVVRLTAGEVIQVRTGVIQGIGPQGPIGPTGPAGVDGPQGTQGVPGPSGAIVEYSSEFAAPAVSVASGTPLLVSWNVTRDDISAAVSATNFQLPVGQYYVSAWVQLSKQVSVAASGSRSLTVLYNSTVVGGDSKAAAPTVASDLNVNTAINVTVGTQILQIQLTHDEGATLSIVTGRLWISRVGPGPAGPAGPIGATGPAGAVGAQGPIGPAGAVANNTTTYTTLGG